MIPILTYHRVGRPKEPHVPTVSAEAFERQLAWLKRFGCRSADLDAHADAIEGRRRALPRRSVIITFDDGYEETAAIAAPLLARYGFRSTVFMTVRDVGAPGFMTWEQLRGVLEQGMSIGSHTMTHADLPSLDREQLRSELSDSKRALEQGLGQRVSWLSYPIGAYSSQVQEAAREAGYRGACTTNRGISKRAPDLFAIRRIKSTDRDAHPVVLWAKVSGCYDGFRRLAPPS